MSSFSPKKINYSQRRQWQYQRRRAGWESGRRLNLWHHSVLTHSFLSHRPTVNYWVTTGPYVSSTSSVINPVNVLRSLLFFFSYRRKMKTQHFLIKNSSYLFNYHRWLCVVFFFLSRFSIEPFCHQILLLYLFSIKTRRPTYGCSDPRILRSPSSTTFRPSKCLETKLWRHDGDVGRP